MKAQVLFPSRRLRFRGARSARFGRTQETAWLPKALVKVKEVAMKIVVIGGTRMIGSRLVTSLKAQGHEAVAASPKAA